MEITSEMRKKAAQAASPAELAAMARAEGIALSDSDAERYYRFLHTGGELDDDDLEQVAGGKGDSGNSAPSPRYQVGQIVEVFFPITKNSIMGYITAIVDGSYTAERGWKYLYHVDVTCDSNGLSSAANFDTYGYLESDPDCKVY